MIFTVEAVYENGVLKLGQPLPFSEHEKVEVTVRSTAATAGHNQSAVVTCPDAATIEWAAMTPELEYPAAEEAP